MKNICSVLQGGEVLHAGAEDAVVSAVQPDGAAVLAHGGVPQQPGGHTRLQGGHQGGQAGQQGGLQSDHHRHPQQCQEGAHRAEQELRAPQPGQSHSRARATKDDDDDERDKGGGRRGGGQGQAGGDKCQARHLRQHPPAVGLRRRQRERLHQLQLRVLRGRGSRLGQ